MKPVRNKVDLAVAVDFSEHFLDPLWHISNVKVGVEIRIRKLLEF